LLVQLHLPPLRNRPSSNTFNHNFFSSNPPSFTSMQSDMTLDGELFVGRGKFSETVSIVKTVGSTRWNSVSYHVSASFLFHSSTHVLLSVSSHVSANPSLLFSYSCPFLMQQFSLPSTLPSRKVFDVPSNKSDGFEQRYDTLKEFCKTQPPFIKPVEHVK
jgi:hypothetical protein